MIHKMREREFSDMRIFEKWLTETMKRKILRENESNTFTYWNKILK